MLIEERGYLPFGATLFRAFWTNGVKRIPEAFGQACNGLKSEALDAFANAGDELYDIWQEGGALPRAALVVAVGTTAGPVIVAGGYYLVPYTISVCGGAKTFMYAFDPTGLNTASAVYGWFTETGLPQGMYGGAAAFFRAAYDFTTKKITIVLGSVNVMEKLPGIIMGCALITLSVTLFIKPTGYYLGQFLDFSEERLYFSPFLLALGVLFFWTSIRRR